MSFINELKRRNVIRVGIAYAVVTWLVLQFADVVLNNITAPAWVFQAIMLLLAIGFPVVLIIAWAFEMTPEGLKKEKDVDRSESITPKTGHKLDRVIITFMALALVYFVYDKFDNKALQTGIGTSSQSASATGQANSIAPSANAVIRKNEDKSVAVLPFANRSTHPGDEFFAEGMHDDLLTQLAKIGSMKVISRTSVMEYKNTTMKIPEIARELGVATIVEGGIQRSGSRIRFNVQLIDANTDEHLWAETYNRELTAENLFDIQAEIARAIAQALQATLSPTEQASINRALTTNLQAWESYQRAVRIRQSLDTRELKSGIFEVDRALELDPDFAAAWSLKAILLLQQYWFYDTDIATRDAAFDAIQKGRAIDPTLAELDLAEGYYYYWGFRDYEKALPFMLRASAALPNNARSYLAKAYVLRRMGDWENALAALRHASELDPRQSTTMTDIAGTLTTLGRFKQARLMFAKAQEIDPDNPNGLWERSAIELAEHGDITRYAHLNHLMPPPHPEAQLDTWRSSLYVDDFEAALKDVDEWQERYLDSKDYRFTRLMLKGLTYRYAGDSEMAEPLLLEAEKQFEILLNREPGDYAVLRSLCLIEGGLGNPEQAKKYCGESLLAAPKDKFLAGAIKFDAAAGLALAGDANATVKLLRAIQDGDVGPSIYKLIYHPAFDGIRDDPTYIRLLEQYGPDTQ